MDLHQIYNRLGVDRSIKVRCTESQVPTIRNAIHKKQSLLNGLVGRQETLKSKYDRQAGILHFWFIPAVPKFDFEIVEDNDGTQIRGDVEPDSKKRNGYHYLPSGGSQDLSEGYATRGLETTPSTRTSRTSEFREDEDYTRTIGWEQEDESEV